MFIALIYLPLLLFAQQSLQNNKGYELKSKGLTISLSREGIITKMWLGKSKVGKEVNAYTDIEGCHIQGRVVSHRLKHGGVEFKKILVNDSLQTSCTLTERFIPTKSSIRWEISILSNGRPWGSRIKSVFHYPVKSTSRFWAPWGEPQYDSKALDSKLRQKLDLPEHTGLAGTEKWRNPLLPLPFTNTTLYYGGAPLNDKDPNIPYSPYHGNLIGIPMCSVLDAAEQTGFTIALSPADKIIDLVLNSRDDGTITFSREHNRIPSDAPITFNLDLVEGENDWRDGLGWMAGRYPRYFKPITQDALKYAGTGAYSSDGSVPDTNRLKKLGFTVNWDASFDFPYMGMFLPPVKKGEEWRSFRGETTSALKMDNYAREMRDAGFYVFNYFNASEFGSKIVFPPDTTSTDYASGNRWMNSSRFLYDSLLSGVMTGSDKMNISSYSGKQPGGFFYSWEGSVVMDCGDPAYQRFLLRQARRYIDEIPNSSGICIDRMDWLRLFNREEDDGIAWYNGKPARSLISSWKQLMGRLGPLMHNNGKSILVNNLDKRIDLLNHVDGIFDEYTYAPAPLNLTALLSVYKPALGWTDNADRIKHEGVDNFFQKYLYMGVYPMCPFPGNDHAIQPDSLTDAMYLKYAPLLIAMKERSWILKPHVISVKGNVAMANIFSIPKGYAIPVVYAKQGVKEVEVILRNIDIRTITSCFAYHPGSDKAVPASFVKGKNDITITVPVKKGCAMVMAERN